MAKPRDKEYVEYQMKEGKIVSSIRYNCGCSWEIEWIRCGEAKETINTFLCEEHDPTINSKGKILNF